LKLKPNNNKLEWEENEEMGGENSKCLNYATPIRIGFSQELLS
jgi:hypothetical protein